jgi:predicted Ser/Thr protein kinase
MVTATPTKLGRYKILDEIGRGAMGVVYLAKDPLIGRLVAIKTFRMGAALSGRELEMFRARFIREAQSAGILSHPNIVTIHDVVEESEEGATFIAMEYVRGTDLKEILASQQQLDLKDVVNVVSQVAEGLDYAHSQGVVHRDVKPANILITQEQEVKLTDFGIARLDTSNLTLEGQLLGTPNYMAPEQIQGQATDHRADIFSLGVVLYEMLTGEKPFKGENVTVVTHRIVYEEYTAPADHVGHLPEPVLEVLSKALAKDPDDRYSGVRELAEALRAAVAAVRSEEELNETQEVMPVGAALVEDTGSGTHSRPAPAGPSAAARLAAAARGAGRRLGAGAVAATVGARRLAGRLVAAGGGVPPLPRLALVAAVTVGTGVLLAGLLLFAARGSEGAVDLEGPPAASHLHAQRVAAAPFLRQARLRLEQGDPEAAVPLLLQAEKAAPEIGQIRAQRIQVEEQAQSLDQLEEKSDRVASSLEEARSAAEERRWEDAREAAQTVLSLEPENIEALSIVARIDDTEAREKRRREAAARARAEARKETKVAEAKPVAPAPPVKEETEATGESHLDLYYFSALPEGVLTVYFNGEQLIREPYRFVRREKLFRTVPSHGQIENGYTVPPGEATLRILVALPGKPAISRVIEGNFPDGRSRRLNVQLSEDETLSARLE